MIDVTTQIYTVLYIKKIYIFTSLHFNKIIVIKLLNSFEDSDIKKYFNF